MRVTIALLPCIALPACVEQIVDLRVPSAEVTPIDSGCGWRERPDPVSGECLQCEYRTPLPGSVCPCGVQPFSTIPFPYCDTPDAYYECAACTGSIDSCDAFFATNIAAQLGTSNDCSLLIECCRELSSGADPCCGDGFQLRCAQDPGGDIEVAPYIVACLPDPCCLGSPCPNGVGDCAAWQSCVQGFCTPACEPDVQECCALCNCQCQTVGNPP